MHIDSMDRKILYELDLNSRKPLSQTAKKLRINRNVLLYRINKMREEGIIKGTFTQVNNFALGYLSFRIFIKFGNCNLEQERKMIDELKSEKHLLWLSRVLGKWDLDLIYMGRSMPEFDNFQKDLLIKYNPILEDYETALMTGIYDYPKDFIIDKPRQSVTPKKSIVHMNIPIEPLQMEILRLMADDATMNIMDIAKKTKSSINTVKKKLNDLIKKKIILAFRLRIDTNKLGYLYYKLHIKLRNYTEKDLNSLKSFLESKNFMISTDHYLGGEQFEIELNLFSENDYIRFFEELKEKFGPIIKDHFVIKFYDELVYRYVPASY